MSNDISKLVLNILLDNQNNLAQRKKTNIQRAEAITLCYQARNYWRVYKYKKINNANIIMLNIEKKNKFKGNNVKKSSLNKMGEKSK